jgi:hypothetical protein
VYKICTGGGFAGINGCGKVVANWLDKSSSHREFAAVVDASVNIQKGRATFHATFDCLSKCAVAVRASVEYCLLRQ